MKNTEDSENLYASYNDPLLRKQGGYFLRPACYSPVLGTRDISKSNQTEI